MTTRVVLLLTGLLIPLIAATAAFAGPRELTVHSDGILLELELTARKGMIEVTLPHPIREGTVRIRPLQDAQLGQVTLLPAGMPERQRKELDALTEQKFRLEDRLKALDTREGIFAAAARSQSSKAPRKSKSNPDPLASVRQGTEFAIAQLESVFTARRRAEQELKRVEQRIADLRKAAASGPTVRAQLSTPTGKARLTAVLQGGGWQPRYEIRLLGSDAAQLVLLGELEQKLPEGFRVSVTPAALAASGTQPSYHYPANGPQRLAEWRLTAASVRIATGPLPAFAFQLNGPVPELPAGEAAVYAAGEYLGLVPLPALGSGKSVQLQYPLPTAK